MKSPIITVEGKQYVSTDSFERLARDVNKRIVAALAQPQPEPVGHIYTIAGVQHCTIEQVLPDGPLYTAPPKLEWVGLSDEDKEIILYDRTMPIAAVLDVTEAKLKEKNT